MAKATRPASTHPRQGTEADAATWEVLSDCASALDLPLVAEALDGSNKCRFLRELFYAPEDPPKGSRFFAEAGELAAGDPVRDGRIGLPHVVLGRLAKEGLIQEILTTNYDCLLETGCLAVGMVPYEAAGGPAQDRPSICPGRRSTGSSATRTTCCSGPPGAVYCTSTRSTAASPPSAAG